MTRADDTSLLRQPKAVWAVAFACVVAFMGIGLVDPILPAIASQLDASPSQVELLFTSYFAVTGVAMLITGFVSSRIGAQAHAAGRPGARRGLQRAGGRLGQRRPRSSASARAGAWATRCSSPPRCR